MEPPLRLRIVNMLLLSSILAMYIFYDAGFRYWMTQGDEHEIRAAILHEAVHYRRDGGVGLSFDAAAQDVGTPALQAQLLETTRWRRGTTNTTVPPAPPLPMAAIVVESTWLTPDQDAASTPYALRLLEAYRYALLTGAPWLLLAGSAAETSMGLQFLRTLPQPAEALFGESAMQRLSLDMMGIASPIRDSMLHYATLGEWMHAANSRPLSSFLTSSLPSSSGGGTSLSASAALHFHHYPAVRGGPSSALQLSLRQLLSANALTNVEDAASHVRPAALVLAAEWLSRFGDAASTVSSGSSPRVTVYATSDQAAAVQEEEAEEGEEGATRTASAQPSPQRNVDESGVALWEVPRVRELMRSGTRPRVHLVAPGIVTVTVPDTDKRPRFVAAALQQLLEKTLLRRHALDGPATASQAEKAWWWWLGQSYGVTIVAGGWEQQRIKLLYMKALREAAAETLRGLRKAAHDIHRTRCQFSGTPPTQLPATALPFHGGAPAAPRVFAVSYPFEGLIAPEPKPDWLNYTGELPPFANPSASRAARAIGRVSFFLYWNYRRWMDWCLASLPVGSYQDHFLLLSVLMSDLADHRISLWDVLSL